jgi:hypothetical protein
MPHGNQRRNIAPTPTTALAIRCPTLLRPAAGSAPGLGLRFRAVRATCHLHIIQTFGVIGKHAAGTNVSNVCGKESVGCIGSLRRVRAGGRRRGTSPHCSALNTVYLMTRKFPFVLSLRVGRRGVDSAVGKGDQLAVLGFFTCPQSSTACLKVSHCGQTEPLVTERWILFTPALNLATHGAGGY